VTRRRLLCCVVAALLLTAGCVGDDTDPSTPTALSTPASTPTSTPSHPMEVVTPTLSGAPSATPTPTSTSSPTPTPTLTPTPSRSPTPTPTPTATATPTPTPTPDSRTTYIGDWVETTHNDTEVRIRVRNYRVRESIETRDGGTENASEGERFVIARVEIVNDPGWVTVGRDQWTLIDWTDERHSPDGVTDDIANPFPEEERMHNDHVEGTIVWELEYYEDPTFEAEPYGDQPGVTLQFVEE
jgi:hypothetical protein